MLLDTITVKDTDEVSITLSYLSTSGGSSRGTSSSITVSITLSYLSTLIPNRKSGKERMFIMLVKGVNYS